MTDHEHKCCIAQRYAKRGPTWSLDAETARRFAEDLRRQGLSLRAIGRALSDHGFERQKGKPWHPTEVQRLLYYGP